MRGCATVVEEQPKLAVRGLWTAVEIRAARGCCVMEKCGHGERCDLRVRLCAIEEMVQVFACIREWHGWRCEDMGITNDGI